MQCSIKYSASPNNYKKFKFYELDDNKRETYVTNGDSEKLIKNIMIINIEIYLKIKFFLRKNLKSFLK